MFGIDVEPGKPILVVKASGLIQSADYFEFLPEFELQISEIHPKGLLLDWTELTGWDEAAESVGFFTRVDLRSKFKCIAILASSNWTSEIKDLEDLTRLPIRRFPTSDRQSALDWLDATS